MPILRVKKLHPQAVLPSRATQGSAGYDLSACLAQPVTIAPGRTEKIPTGLAIDLGTPDRAAFIFARSGLGIKHGIVPANCVGVIDSDYRGEILVGLTNHSGESYTVAPGERVAQMVILPVLTPEIQEAEALEESDRGAGGFGSTGKQ